jgi:N-hydroxyarylamine O-acetyltransferase
MSGAIDLDAYFARIGYAGPRDANLATLRALHALHPQAIAFENLDALLGRPIPLDIGALERKLVRERRGGWCFEHNLLFAAVLEALGFAVRRLAARVLWNAAPGALTPRSHMLLAVEIDGATWIADVGFGGLTLTAPLCLALDIEQPTPHERFRLSKDVEEHFVLQAEAQGEWQPLYRFELQRQFLADYEVSNWYLSHHPRSHFVNGLMAARAGSGLRHALRDNRFTLHRLGAEPERRCLDSAAELRAVLEGAFALALPDAPEVEALLERLAQRRD